MTRRARVAFTASAILLMAVLFSPPARGIPAFARKYGLRCTACHEAWPRLNDFGRAFRDNGYQMLLGKDAPITTSPAYWPVAIRIVPNYQYNKVTNQPTDQGTKNLGTGGFAELSMDLLTAGTLFNDVSFLVVATGFAPDGYVTLESAWMRFDNLFGSSWANLKIGKHEVDLPRSAHRPWNLSGTGYLIYGFHANGSASVYDMGENQVGIEYMGHDRGSLNRVAFSAFDVEGSPGSRNFFSTPGFYAHATHEWVFDSSTVSSFKAGVFGAYTTFPTTFYTSGGEPIPGEGGNLEPSSKYGLEANASFGPAATPFSLQIAWAFGQDNMALIPDATRNGTFNGGFAELGWTFALKNLIFVRYDLCQNVTQGVVGTPKDANDQNAITAGMRHYFDFSNRASLALHLEYSSLQTKGAGVDGLNTRTNTYFAGIDFDF